MRRNSVNFVKCVKLILKDREIKIGDFEKQLGVSVGYFARLKNPIKLTMAFKICDLLEMDLNDIFEYKNKAIMREIERLKSELD